MPRDSNGAYTLPSGYRAVTGQKVLASQHNPPLEDLASAITGSFARNGTSQMLADFPMGGFKITGMAAGTLATDAVTKGQLDALIPVGTIWDYAAPAAPDGWLLCYGQAVSRSAYPTLFSVIGTRFGSGDGSTTFNLPDLRGRVLAGADSMGGTAAGRLSAATMTGAGTYGGVGGVETVAISQAQLPSYTLSGGSASSHTHTYLRFSGLTSAQSGSGVTGLWAGQADVATSGAVVSGITIPSGGSGAAHSNVQPTMALNKIIKV